MPSIPVHINPQIGQSRTLEIAREDKSEEKIENIIVEALPWEKLLKTPPPENTITPEPSPKRNRMEERPSNSLTNSIDSRTIKEI